MNTGTCLAPRRGAPIGLVVRGLLAPLLLASGVLAPSLFAQGDEAQKPTTGVVKIAGIRLQDLDGNVVDMGSYLGKGPILLDFWATWCKPCLAALPGLNELHRDLAPRGLQLVGINEDGQRNAAKVKPFVKTHGFAFPVLLDLNREAQNRLNVAALPTTLLLDPEGKLVHATYGYSPGESEILREKIEPLLPEPQPE